MWPELSRSLSLLCFIWQPWVGGAGQAHNLRQDMPPNEYYELFKPDYSLFISKDEALRNENTKARLNQVSHHSAA
jgi:hypothetical protein